jgi:hypothetical protein
MPGALELSSKFMETKLVFFSAVCHCDDSKYVRLYHSNSTSVQGETSEKLERNFYQCHSPLMALQF